MESMGKKPRRRRSFTAEFKAEIVELCQRGDRSVGQVAKDFDLTETAVREWGKQDERDAGTREDGGLTSTERQELARVAAGEPPAGRGRVVPQAGHGFLRGRDPVSVYPFIEAEKAGSSQRQAGVRAAEGLPCRLLSAPGRPIAPLIRPTSRPRLVRRCHRIVKGKFGTVVSITDGRSIARRKEWESVLR